MKVLFSGGGTAGHINPALAIAGYLKKTVPDIEILFAGSKSGMEGDLVPRAGFAIENVSSKGLSRGFSFEDIARNIKSIFFNIVAFAEAARIINRFKPDIVIGTGGYVSFHIVHTAAKKGIPTIIHEQNAIPGMTTKLLAKRASRIMISFAESTQHFEHKDKLVLTGNPVRPEILYASREEARKKLGIGDEPFILSFFGSLGARFMNGIMAEFIKEEVKSGFFVRHTHVTGKEGYKWVPAKIAELGVDLDNSKNIDVIEYAYNMDEYLAAADIVISRAGAITASELLCAGKPSVIIPSPNVVNNHQEYNALALEKMGASKVIFEKELTAQKLFNEVKGLLEDKETLKKMSINALNSAIPDSNERIYKVIKETMLEK